MCLLCVLFVDSNVGTIRRDIRHGQSHRRALPFGTCLLITFWSVFRCKVKNGGWQVSSTPSIRYARSQLRSLVDDASYADAVCWTEDGSAIVIPDVDLFVRRVLGAENNVFKTRNYSSFVRQLNMYGFSKVCGA